MFQIKLLPDGSTKRCRPLKAARSATPSDRPTSLSTEGTIGELARRVLNTNRQKHGVPCTAKAN